MRKFKIISLILVFSLTVFGLAACDMGNGVVNDGTEQVWQVNVLRYETTDWIESGIGGYGYSPDEGYEWLKINVQVKNLTNRTKSINWLLDTFEYVSHKEHYHSQRLQYNDPPGYIDTSYNPKQQKEGFIVFEVPEGLDVSLGKLFWQPFEGEDKIFEF